MKTYLYVLEYKQTIGLIILFHFGFMYSRLYYMNLKLTV